MRCSTSAGQCLQIFWCGAVQCADRTLVVWVQCSKNVPVTFLVGLVIELDEASRKSAISHWMIFFLGERRKSLEKYHGSQAGDLFFF